VTVKIASIFIPAYVKPAHVGQTPDPQPHRLVEQWERELVNRAPGVVKHKPHDRLYPDKAFGGVGRQVVIRYDFEVDMDEPSLSEIIALALTIFNLKMVTVYLDDTQAEDFDSEAAENLSLGIHDWANHEP